MGWLTEFKLQKNTVIVFPELMSEKVSQKRWFENPSLKKKKQMNREQLNSEN
jgi:hypothetical protein